jgi:predicted N-acetyltransferase YhbS
MYVLRPEQPTDFAAIAELEIRAFAQRVDEAALVALLRQHPGYRPELTLVAEADGQIVGHAQFTLVTVRIDMADVPAVILAPLAVLPGYQRQGVGTALLDAGHAAAREYGAAISILIGHSSYYPRFGYVQRLHGAASLRLEHALSLPLVDLSERSPTEDDLAALQALWQAAEGAVDFAVAPTARLSEWLSPNPGIACRVWMHQGELVAYTRIHVNQPTAPRAFYARDAAAAQALAGALARRVGANSLELPLHPHSAGAAALGNATVQPWNGGMACALVTGALDELISAQAAGRPAGRIIWPTVFDCAA